MRRILPTSLLHAALAHTLATPEVSTLLCPQLVQKLRLSFEQAVLACSRRLIRMHSCNRQTNLRVLLGAPEPQQRQQYTQHRDQGQQQELLVQAMLMPLFDRLELAMVSLRTELDLGVCKAAMRSCWDLLGKEVHDFLMDSRADQSGRARARSQVRHLCLWTPMT